MQNQETCLLTGIPVEGMTTTAQEIKYTLSLKSGKEYAINICKTCWEKHSKFLEKNQVTIRGLLLNDKVKIPKDARIHWEEHHSDEENVLNLQTLLAETDYPKTPSEKLEHLFLALYHRQDWDGDAIPTYNDQDVQICGAYYVANFAEYTFYLEALVQQGLLHKLIHNKGYRLSYAGLNRVIELQESGAQSNRCFIAMSFSNEEKIKQIRAAIKAACIQTGFTPILIDEVHFDSDVTINDAMIAEIKRCKFCIADFTQQKDGVYFESGFASGRGLKVIYTCHREDRHGRHFDVRAFPFLYYEDTKNLTRDLVNKINAWIVD